VTEGTAAPAIVVYHRNPDGRAALARSLGAFARVEHADSLPHAVELLALSAAACLIVDLPQEPRARVALAQIAAAYPQTKLLVLADALPFDIARELVRAGVRDVLPLPLDAAVCVDAVRDALSDGVDPPDRLRGMCVAVASGKGGAGCTAVALNLAGALVAHGAAMIVDADAPPFGTLAVASDVEPGGGIAGLVRQRLPLEPRVLRQSAAAHPGGFLELSLWAAPGDLPEVEGILAGALDACAAIASFVVVDVGRPVLPAQRLLLRRASVTVAVTTLDLPSLRNLRQLADVLVADGRSGPAPLLVLNRVDREASYTVDQASAAIGQPFAAVLPFSHALRARLDRGELMLAADPEDPWSGAIRGLAREIAARRRDAVRSALGEGGLRAARSGDGEPR